MARLGYAGTSRKGATGARRSRPSSVPPTPSTAPSIQLTLAMSARPTGEPSTPDELHAVERIQYYMQWDSGYSTQQRTRPQTLGYGLADSPVGQLAWILEKFWAWTDCDGHPENVLTRDELLDNVMLYWLHGVGDLVGSHLLGELRARKSSDVDVPTGFAVYPKEIVPPVREWVERALSERRPLAGARQGRPLRRIRSARDVRARPARMLRPGKEIIVVKTVFKLFGGVFVAVLGAGRRVPRGHAQEVAGRARCRAEDQPGDQAGGAQVRGHRGLDLVGRPPRRPQVGYRLRDADRRSPDRRRVRDRTALRGEHRLAQDVSRAALRRSSTMARPTPSANPRSSHGRRRASVPESTQRTLRLFKVDICLRVRSEA